MGDLSRFRGLLGSGRRHWRTFGLGAALVLGVAGLAWLRSAHLETSPETYLYLEIAGTFLSFCYAANALVRFRGTHDRIALVLAFGFVTSGVIETVGYFGLHELLERGPSALSQVPMGWMVGRTLLGILLLAAILVERNIPLARQPSREIAGALLAVAAASYVTSAAFLAAPAAPVVQSTQFLARPGTCFLHRSSFWRRSSSGGACGSQRRSSTAR